MLEKLEGLNIPKHLAIIMDGNGRWAKARGEKRTFGHKAGANTLEKVANLAGEYGIKYLTVYAFSTENWRRPKKEVAFLMGLIRKFLKESLKTAKDNNMCVKIIGSRKNMDKDINDAMDRLEEVSKDYTGMTLQLAINYGGRDEIIRSIKKIEVAKKENENFQLTEENFADFLDTKGIPDPDLMIRTSGEKRLSNFLIWQLAYTEYWFTETLWPDFGEEELMNALYAYNKVERRYGGLLNET